MARIDGQLTGPGVPKCAVASVDPCKVRSFCLILDCSIEIVDFGELFCLLASVRGIPRRLGTYVGIAALNIVLEGENAVVGLSADI